MRPESMEFLEKLLTATSPCGFESPGQRVWCDYVRPLADEIRTDAYGNAIAVLNRGGDGRVLIEGHVDEIGLMVKHIDEKGFVFFQRNGVVDPALVRGKRVDIHTPRGVVRGVVGATAIHLQAKDKEPKVPQMHELFIDIGATDGKAAARRVSVGDPIMFVDGFEMLTENVLVARGLDDRAGAWAVAEQLRMVKGKKLACELCVASSIQEETGLNGGHMLAVGVKPDTAIAVDMTHATDSPGVDVKLHGLVKMGKGPTLAAGRENHPELVKRLRRVAGRVKIPVQTEPFLSTGSSNAKAYWVANGGTPACIMSIPSRYVHSTVEMLDIRDLQRTAELLAAFVLDLKAGERFKVEV